MPETVIVQIEPPTDYSSGVVSEGYYTLEGDRLTMTYADGSPVNVLGQRVERVLSPSDDPRKVAGRLTKELRLLLKGRTAAQDAFARTMPQQRPNGFA